MRQLLIAVLFSLTTLLWWTPVQALKSPEVDPPSTIPLVRVLQRQRAWQKWEKRWQRRKASWKRWKQTHQKRWNRRHQRRWDRWQKRWRNRRWKRLPRRYRYGRYSLCRRIYRRLRISSRKAKKACKKSQREKLKHTIRIALKTVALFKKQLDSTSEKEIQRIKRYRQRRFSVSRWFWDRYHSSKTFKMLDDLDRWVQPTMFQWPQKSWRRMLVRLSRLLAHPGLSRRHETALVSRLSRWQVQRLEPVAARISIRKMWKHMLRKQECPWWYLLYVTTLSPGTMKKLGKHISPDWCKARRTGMSVSHMNAKTMEKKMRRWARKYRRVVKLHRIGYSSEGRPIFAMQLGFRRKVASKPKIVLVGSQHGDEHLGTDLLMQMTGRLLRRYHRREREIRRWLVTRQIWVIPLLNPDAREFDLVGGVVKWWRYNRHVMSNGEIGVDLNRNFSHKWKPWKFRWYRGTFLPGTKPFSEPETYALKRLFSRMRNIRAVLDVHQYGRVLLMPWAFTKKKVLQPYFSRYRYLSNRLRRFNRYRSFPARRLYPHQGTLGDWGFGAHKAWSLVLELGSRNYVSREYKKYIIRSNRFLLDEFIRLGANPFPFSNTTSGVPAN